MSKCFNWMRRLSVLAVLGIAIPVNSQEVKSGKVVPSSRKEMLNALELLKHRQPRIPLPKDAPEPGGQSVAISPAVPGSPGSLGVVNNGLMRSHYLPEELQSRGGLSSVTSDNALPYDFVTKLFWIVSRVNNCHYCLGHQEAKLQAVGMTEESLLALDTDWSQFSEKERVAFDFSRQLTLAPHRITERDIEPLRRHFSDLQILEIAFVVGRYNSTNRWTDSLGIPQEHHRDYLSRLSDEEISRKSQVAVYGFQPRPGFVDYAAWKSAFDKEASRESWLPIDLVSTDGLPRHEALLTAIPAAGANWVKQTRDAERVGQLKQVLRHKIAYVAARSDHAWYMQHLSRQKLLADGLSEEDIFHLAKTPDELAAASIDAAAPLDADALALAFALKLTEQPQSMTDSDVEQLTKHFSPHEIAEIVFHVGLAALLNRLTEVAQFGWE